jgi:hypothetical protein
VAETTIPMEHALDPERDRRRLDGIIAEFEDAHAVVEAARRTRAAGFEKIDAFSPLPVEGLSDALGQRDFSVPLIMLAGGILGGVGGFALLWYCTSIAYPLNIGGRPLLTWPSFMPITFELTVLISALSGIAGMFALNGLPHPYHPVFDAPDFYRASSDRFFLYIEATDSRFDREETARFMEGLPGAVRVSEVELKK